MEGDAGWWPEACADAELPDFDCFNRQSYYIEVFNRGKAPLSYSVESEKPWLKTSKAKGKLASEERIWVSVDWGMVPEGKQSAGITVTGPQNCRIIVHAKVDNSPMPKGSAKEFIESNGCVSIEAEHFTRSVETPSVSWLKIPGLGRTLSAMTPEPVTSPAQSPGGAGPHLEYTMFLVHAGEVTVNAYLSPTLNVHNDQGLRYGISFDDEPPQIISMNGGNSSRVWEEWVASNINMSVSRHTIQSPGAHTLKFWMIDPGVVLQKIVVDAGGVKPSYLGPPESFFWDAIIDLHPAELRFSKELTLMKTMTHRIVFHLPENCLLLIFLFTILLFGTSAAQPGRDVPISIPPTVEIAGTQSLHFTSAIVGQEFALYVNIPQDLPGFDQDIPRYLLVGRTMGFSAHECDLW